MAYTIILHVANSAPVKLEVDELPDPMAVSIIGKNPRERNDKDFEWLDEGVETVIFPWWRINYVQVLPGDEVQEDFPMPWKESR